MCPLQELLHLCYPQILQIWDQRPSACWSVVLIGCIWTSCHFVPNLTIGAPVIQSLRKHTDAFLDCHLMVTNPSDYVAPFAQAGASGFTFHIEVVKDEWKDLLKSIKSAGMQAGVALRPGTSVEQIFPLVEGEEHVDMVLVMTVEPGFGGQKFMPEMMAKVNILRKKFPWLHIEVDGGLGPSTIKEAAQAGANCIVAGSSVFGSQDPAGVISILRSKVQDAAMRGF
ncbi:hypothetical protein GOP47_0024201 [Adiantum capillus-veneris]|uniref:ribulose-phosphate 3-epimerase n=1 Tax=Adiantum capillus-veneris TaxID=13818 RepID=A0A9D4U7F0_ADICA|nr:hypothetical protein GOP47_0024201 [Adiantum capillus-veneris]